LIEQIGTKAQWPFNNYVTLGRGHVEHDSLWQGKMDVTS